MVGESLANSANSSWMDGLWWISLAGMAFKIRWGKLIWRWLLLPASTGTKFVLGESLVKSIEAPKMLVEHQQSESGESGERPELLWIVITPVTKNITKHFLRRVISCQPSINLEERKSTNIWLGRGARIYAIHKWFILVPWLLTGISTCLYTHSIPHRYQLTL